MEIILNFGCKNAYSDRNGVNNLADADFGLVNCLYTCKDMIMLSYPTFQNA